MRLLYQLSHHHTPWLKLFGLERKNKRWRRHLRDLLLNLSRMKIVSVESRRGPISSTLDSLPLRLVASLQLQQKFHLLGSISYQSRAPLLEHASQEYGPQALSRHTCSGKIWSVFWTACRQPLQSCPPEYWPLKRPNREEPWSWQNPVRKEQLKIEEDLGWKVAGSK